MLMSACNDFRNSRSSTHIYKDLVFIIIYDGQNKNNNKIKCQSKKRSFKKAQIRHLKIYSMKIDIIFIGSRVC